MVTLNSTALFLGKFQPPHLGHVITIRALNERYSKVIVGVTQSDPLIIPATTIIEIFRKVLPDSQFSFIAIPGSVEEGTAEINCTFDVVASGNPKVLEKLKARGFAVDFVERSYDSMFSGTRERKNFIDRHIRGQGTLRTSEQKIRLEFVDTASLRPIEKINPRHFRAIEKQILLDGTIYKPLLVDRLTMAVLDGSHRYAFLKKNQFRLAPVILVDYDDESIFVGNHLAHRFDLTETKWITKAHVRATAMSGDLYPPRTTRHFFPFRKHDLPASLGKLGRGSEVDISHLFGETTLEAELASNQEYIAELVEERKILEEYAREQSEVMEWLSMQNESIKSGTKSSA